METFIIIITSEEGDEDEINLLVEILNFKKTTRPQNPEKKQVKKNILKNLSALFDGRERVFDAIESKKYFQLKLKVQVFQTRSLTILISNY